MKKQLVDLVLKINNGDQKECVEKMVDNFLEENGGICFSDNLGKQTFLYEDEDDFENNTEGKGYCLIHKYGKIDLKEDLEKIGLTIAREEDYTPTHAQK